MKVLVCSIGFALVAASLASPANIAPGAARSAGPARGARPGPRPTLEEQIAAQEEQIAALPLPGSGKPFKRIIPADELRGESGPRASV